MTCVNWHDAQAFVSWLRRRTGVPYRLQTDAEWNRAVAGSRPGCYRDRTGRLGTCPVGSYGANTAGLSDMAGNVTEWTRNCWQGDCDRRVTCDSSWFGVAEALRSPGCFWAPSDRRISDLGFRVSRDARLTALEPHAPHTVDRRPLIGPKDDLSPRR